LVLERPITKDTEKLNVAISLLDALIGFSALFNVGKKRNCTNRKGDKALLTG